MRWYVEPLASHQRTFNLAILTLVDELAERTEGDVNRLERRARGAGGAPCAGPREPQRMRIAVCAPQVPFERGGTEIVVETLVDSFAIARHEVELVQGPVQVVSRAAAFARGPRLAALDLEEAQGRPIDLLIATKFPSYAIRHPNKVVWLVHQFRQAYDLDGTELGQFGDDPFDRATVRAIQKLDREMLGEARRLFAISGNVADRLRRSTGLDAEVLLPPPQQLDYRSSDGAGTFILSVGRLDRSKRVDLLLEAAALDKEVQVVVAGDGPDRERLEQLAAQRGLDGRVRFAGRVDEEELVGSLCRLPCRLLRADRRRPRSRPVRGVPFREARGHDA